MIDYIKNIWNDGNRSIRISMIMHVAAIVIFALGVLSVSWFILGVAFIVLGCAESKLLTGFSELIDEKKGA